jgi:hypothetical protein
MLLGCYTTQWLGGRKSIVREKDSYLLELIPYIHLNRLRARLVADLDALSGYSWSDHRVT